MTIQENFDVIRKRMAEAAQKAGRDLSSIRLVAVSKTKTQADVLEAYAAGQRYFGENRVQEASTKFLPIGLNHPDIELHLIGPLQTNKAEDAVELFDVIETLDRPKLATELAKAIQKVGRTPQFYIEVNIGDEPQKAGIAVAALNDFLAFCTVGCGLNVTGLMAIPPVDQDPKPYFDKLRELAKLHNLRNLSMGMSGDFEEAIASGATEIRVGTALFQARS